MSRKFTFRRRQLATGHLIPFALFPDKTAFPVLLDAPPLIEVLWIVGPSLAIEPPLQPPPFASIWLEFCPKRLEPGCSLTRNDRNRRRTKIKTDHIGSRHVLLFLMRDAL